MAYRHTTSNNGEENGLRFGDVTGGGTRMGVSIKERVEREDEKMLWGRVLWGLWTGVSCWFWVLGFFLHQFSVLVIWSGFTAQYFETKTVCRLNGYLPSLCKQVRPHWVFGIFRKMSSDCVLYITTAGIVVYILRLEDRHPVLRMQRDYIRRIAIAWSVSSYFLPSGLVNLVRPVDSVVGYISLGAQLAVRDITLLVVAMVFSRVTGLSSFVCQLVLNACYDMCTRSWELNADGFKGIQLEGWLAKLFGRCAVSATVKESIDTLLSTKSTDESWNRVRVQAYAGDKLSYYMVGLKGAKEHWKVSDVQSEAKVFDNANLRLAMRRYAKVWWDKSPEYMRDTPSATVLEALACLILTGVEDEEKRQQVFNCYFNALKSVRAYEQVDDSGDDNYQEC